MFFQRIEVNQMSRVLLIKNGKLQRVLSPGRHLVFLWPFADWRVELHRVYDPAFRSRWADQVVRERCDLVEKHFHLVETRDSELAMISVDGNLYQVLLPSRTALFWKDAGKVKVEFVNLVEEEDGSDGDEMFESIKLPKTSESRETRLFEDSTTELIERALDRDSSTISGSGH